MHRLTKENTSPMSKNSNFPHHVSVTQHNTYPVTFSAHTYLYPKHSDWACSVGTKASITAERSCATGSHLSPIVALMPPATATLRSSTAPNSCKRPRSHSAPSFTALFRNSSHRASAADLEDELACNKAYARKRKHKSHQQEKVTSNLTPALLNRTFTL